MIAKQKNIVQSVVSDVIKKIIGNGQLSEIGKDNIYLYNIWNLTKTDNNADHFGAEC